MDKELDNLGKYSDKLIYRDDFITSQEEKAILSYLDQNEFRTRTDLDKIKSRQMQTYGYRYLKGEHDMALHRVEPIPEIICPVLDRINNFCKSLFGEDSEDVDVEFNFNQMTVNRYLPGQGIDSHYDHKTRFGPVIVGLSLGSGTSLIFEENHNKGEIVDLYLKRCSLYVMSGKYRYNWSHKIQRVYYDLVDDVVVKRAVRTSLTFREV